MRKVKRRALIMGVGLLIAITMISGCSNEDVEIKDIVLESTQVVKKEDSGYLQLGEDPFADDAKILQEALVNWNFVDKDSKKIAYFTFDDGPSTVVTEEILDVLKKNDAKGTFFVLGSMIEKNEKNKELLKRMVEEGHAIGNHGYSHKYNELYPGGRVNVATFVEDMNRSLNSMRGVLGLDFYTRVMRFPGGHSAWYTEEIDKYLEENDLVFVDWNTLTGDAETLGNSKEILVNNLKETVNEIDSNNDKIVVLMHDTNANDENAEVLQEVIYYLRSLGYEFRTVK